jgi:hypothetical protein
MQPWSGIDKVLRPVGYLKHKIQFIENARLTYEQCSLIDCKEMLALPSNFQTWFRKTTLHLWMVNSRLKEEKGFRQELFNHLWLDVEIKLHELKVKTRLKFITSSLLDSYYGQMLAYDEGLYFGDCYMSAALWRNLLDRNPEFTFEQLYTLNRYVQNHLINIENTNVATFLDGKFKFNNTHGQKVASTSQQ